MTARRIDRRRWMQGLAAGAAAALWPAPAIVQGAGPRVVVLGGGYAGASCARALRRADPKLAVTLVESNATYTALPLSNAVIAGLRPLSAQQFGYERIAADGVMIIHQPATAVDVAARAVTLQSGETLGYDRLVVAPGIEMRFDALPGYTAQTADAMPHAWTSALQADLLRRQIEAMDDGGVVAIAVPVNPSRCPPGPYERASMIAFYLTSKKPRSKVMILDAKDSFTMQRQFLQAWNELYPGMIEWAGLSKGGNVTSVDVSAKKLSTDFDEVKADVASVIPPQRAGALARIAGVADRTGWCPVNPVTFESTLQPNVHVIGDAAIAGAMPRSGYAANEQGKICGAAIARLLAGATPSEPKLVSTCYSLIAPDYAISIRGTYHPVDGQYVEIEGTGITSPMDAPRSLRAREAGAANAWFKTIMGEVFG